jgi:hypothetical protein
MNLIKGNIEMLVKKFMKYTMLITGLIIVSPLVYAENDGNELLAECTEYENIYDGRNQGEPDFFISGKCLGYVSGVFNLFSMLSAPEGTLPIQEICPSDDGVKSVQLVRIVNSYLRDNPKTLHQGALSLTVRAYLEAFQCEGKA